MALLSCLQGFGMTQLVLHLSCLILYVVLWCCHVWAIGAGAAVPGNWPWHLLSSSAKGPKPGSRSCLGASHWLESSSGIPNDGYSLQCFPEVICLLMPPLLALAVALCQGLMWLCVAGCDQDVLFPLCCAPTPSSSSSLFGLVLSAGCQGGEVPCGGCQLLSWHTVLGTVASLAPAV